MCTSESRDKDRMNRRLLITVFDLSVLRIRSERHSSSLRLTRNQDRSYHREVRIDPYQLSRNHEYCMKIALWDSKEWSKENRNWSDRIYSNVRKSICQQNQQSLLKRDSLRTLIMFWLVLTYLQNQILRLILINLLSLWQFSSSIQRTKLLFYQTQMKLKNFGTFWKGIKWAILLNILSKLSLERSLELMLNGCLSMR